MSRETEPAYVSIEGEAYQIPNSFVEMIALMVHLGKLLTIGVMKTLIDLATTDFFRAKSR